MTASAPSASTRRAAAYPAAVAAAAALVLAWVGAAVLGWMSFAPHILAMVAQAVAMLGVAALTVQPSFRRHLADQAFYAWLVLFGIAAIHAGRQRDAADPMLSPAAERALSAFCESAGVAFDSRFAFAVLAGLALAAFIGAIVQRLATPPTFETRRSTGLPTLFGGAVAFMIAALGFAFYLWIALDWPGATSAGVLQSIGAGLVFVALLTLAQGAVQTLMRPGADSAAGLLDAGINHLVSNQAANRAEGGRRAVVAIVLLGAALAAVALASAPALAPKQTADVAGPLVHLDVVSFTAWFAAFVILAFWGLARHGFRLAAPIERAAAPIPPASPKPSIAAAAPPARSVVAKPVIRRPAATSKPTRAAPIVAPDWWRYPVAGGAGLAAGFVGALALASLGVEAGQRATIAGLYSTTLALEPAPSDTETAAVPSPPPPLPATTRDTTKPPAPQPAPPREVETATLTPPEQPKAVEPRERPVEPKIQPKPAEPKPEPAGPETQPKPATPPPASVLALFKNDLAWAYESLSIVEDFGKADAPTRGVETLSLEDAGKGFCNAETVIVFGAASGNGSETYNFGLAGRRAERFAAEVARLREACGRPVGAKGVYKVNLGEFKDEGDAPAQRRLFALGLDVDAAADGRAFLALLAYGKDGRRRPPRLDQYAACEVTALSTVDAKAAPALRGALEALGCAAPDPDVAAAGAK